MPEPMLVIGVDAGAVWLPLTYVLTNSDRVT